MGLQLNSFQVFSRGRYLLALFNFGKATFLAFVNRQDNRNISAALFQFSKYQELENENFDRLLR